MQPRADIKWFELFYDILIVVGISNVLLMVYDLYPIMGFSVFFKASIIILILFNAWIKIVFFENKIKVLEMKLQEPISGYKLPIMIQFFIIFILIFLFTSDDNFTITLIILIYILLEVSNRLLYDFSYWHTLSLLGILFLSLFNIKVEIITLLFLVQILTDTIMTFKNLEYISNSIFRTSKLKPKLTFLNANVSLPDAKLLHGKIYIPHIMERLGIIMIVFMAEYVLVMLDAAEKSTNPFMTVILLFLFLLFFYMDFFSILEYYDDCLLEIKDKKLKYPKAKATIYFSSLYYISLLAMSLFMKDMFYMKHELFTLTSALVSYIFFEIANLILLNMYNAINKQHKIYYYALKVIGFSIILMAYFYKHSIILLGAIVFAMIINVFASRYNEVVHRFN